MASTLPENGDAADQLLLPTGSTKINGDINGSCEEPMDVDDSPVKPVKKINSSDIICTSQITDHDSDSESGPIRNTNSNSENSVSEKDVASESSKVPEADETTSSNGFVEQNSDLNHEDSKTVDDENDENEKLNTISDEVVCKEENKEEHCDEGKDDSEKSDSDENEDDDDDVVLMEEGEADPLASDPQESEDTAAPESDGGNPMDTSDVEPLSENDPLMVDPKDDEVALECEKDSAKSDKASGKSRQKGANSENDNGEEDGSVEKSDDDKADKTDGEDEKSGESPDKTKSEEDSEKTPEKGKKKKNQQQQPINVTPRRSSRNVNKPKVYIDEPDIKGTPAPKKSTEDPDIEEIVPQDPLAMDSPVSDKRGKKTVVVNDPKRLVEIANGGNKQPKFGKKEPTLVIIDTNSILSGKGPVPVSPGQSQGLGSPSQAFSMLPMALPAQGMYPQALRQMKPVLMTQSNLTVTPAHPKPQPPPILPSLTDDMYVVEAPSFIVPYVYEKPPLKPLKGFVEQVEQAIKEIKAQLEKAKEEEKKAEEKKAEEKKAEEKKADEKETEEKTAEEKETDDAKQEENKTEENNTDVEMKEKHKTDEEDVSTEKEKDEEEKMEVDSDSSKTDKDSEASTSKKDKESTKDSDKTIEVKSDDDKSDNGKTEKPSEDVKTEDGAKKQSGSYFDNPLGKFFIQIGVNLVQEHVQTDLLRSQKRKKEREGAKCTPEVQQAMSSLIRSLEFSKETNEPFKLELKKCEFCSFKTESALVMAHHLETPHMRNYVYRCNFCSLEVRSPHDILYHMEAEHNVRGRLERAPAFHQCPSCPFEDNQKGKLSRHLLSCGKKYRPERNQEPPLDFEPPAKIPRVSRTRPSMSPGTAVYQAAMSGLKGSTGGHPLLPKLVPTATPPGMIRGRGRPQMINRYLGDMRSPALSAQQKALAQMRPGMLYRPSGSNSQPQVLLPTSYQLAGTQLYQVTNHSRGLGATLALPPQNAAAASVSNKSTVGASAAKLLQQPSISITPLPRQAPPATPAAPAASPSNKPGRPPGFNKATFVICEICDGYIKDLEQLRNHMQWIHKVKIHPKMIYNRPPLNCQKCQFRFFTDQGLERHLLGSHGLVTSSMQEAANKGKDGGRCPVCGRVYQWKLLNHVARDHNMSLKPAHLSYKCTVCTATFGMYKQFENHVYSAHSVVAKRVMDKKPATGAQPSTSSQGDMLKPLKINDEITIIPQPARTKTKAVAGSNRNPPKKV